MIGSALKYVVLSAVLASSISTPKAAEMVPFTATWTGMTISADLSGFPVVAVVAEGEGQGSHLGAYTMTSPHTTNVFTGETVGDQIFTAANGDMLTAYCAGFPQSNDGGLTVIGTLECTVTSGTGRFEGASGSYEFFLVATLVPGSPGYSTVAEISGTISTVGATEP